MQGLEDLFAEFSWPRLSAWLLASAALIIAVFVFERWTGYFYLGAVERKVALLTTLSELAATGAISGTELSPIYLRIVEEVNTLDVARPSIPFPEDYWSISSPALRFLGSALIGEVFIIYGVVQYVRTRETLSTAQGALIWTFLFGGIGWAFPALSSSASRITLYLLAQLAILWRMRDKPKQPAHPSPPRRRKKRKRRR
jgi:hypothetical protein